MTELADHLLERCPTCGDPLDPGTFTAGHCTRCLFATTFGELAEGVEEQEGAAMWSHLAGCELFEEIGRGGMGVVYRGRQPKLDRIVAVKVLLRAPFLGPEARERFQREAMAVARLRHPGIVGIHDFGEENGVPWLTMEYLPGENLERLVNGKPMHAAQAATCVREVAAAVEHAHRQGVLHRDIKPSNILMDELGNPRVTDFGLARLVQPGTSGVELHELTLTGQVLGSPGYGAPEQALHGQADVRADVYGLGALLYHLLTGRPPFQGPTLDAILMQVRDSDPVPPRRLNPAVPADLETICLACLQKQPKARYASAEALRDDLDRFLKGQPIRARPLSPLAAAWRWAGRNPSAAILILLTLVFLATLIGGGLGFSYYRKRTHAENSARQAQLEHRVTYLAEARNLRRQRGAENRALALTALDAAWKIAPGDDVRNEVIASLALPELGYLRAVSHPTEPPDPSGSGDGKRTAAVENGALVIREGQSAGEPVVSWPGFTTGSLVKLDDFGERVAVIAPGSGEVRAYQVQTGELIFTCPHPVFIDSIDWSGDLIATGCDNRFVYIWSDRGEMLHRLSGHESTPVRVSFRPGGQELVSTARDQYIRLWHAARGVEIMRRELNHQPHLALWWSADGRELRASTAEGGLEVYSVNWSRVLQVLAPPREEPHSENLGVPGSQPGRRPGHRDR